MSRRPPRLLPYSVQPVDGCCSLTLLSGSGGSGSVFQAIMPRSKESSDELRRKVVEAHEAGKGYKTIGKVYAMHRSTVRQIIYKWKVFNTTETRPRSGRPTKLDTILRLMGKGQDTAHSSGNETSEDVCGSSEGTANISENEDRRTRKDASGIAEEEDNAQVSGPDDVLNLAPHLRPNEVTRKTPKRRRGRIENTKDLKPTRNRLLTSLPTPSSCRATFIPQPDASAEHHAEDMLCCDICGACFTTEPQLEVHQVQHLQKTLHECEECGKAFQSAAGLKTHKTRKHGR